MRMGVFVLGNATFFGRIGGQLVSNAVVELIKLVLKSLSGCWYNVGQ